jgi:hypothetical protein
MNQHRLLSLLAAVGAVFFLGIGLWEFSDASSFFDELADFPPYNAHFIHDVGAFHAGLGAVLAPVPRRILVALGGVGPGRLRRGTSDTTWGMTATISSESWRLMLPARPAVAAGRHWQRS